MGAAGLTCTTPAGRHCNPYDWEHLPDEVLQRMRQRKAERAKALKEWKTMSCVLHNYTGKSLDAFDIPGTCTIRPQLPNEKRIHRTDEIRTRCFLRGDDGTEREILPVAESPGEWAQLTIGLDSGSVGRAAASYSKHKLGLFIFVVFDIIHRMIRDTKLAVESCPAVHRAVLHYTFLTSLNYRPFNSGVWHEDKKMMLQYFKDMLPGKSTNPYFRFYATLWARDIGESASTNEDFENLWGLLDELKSFTNKLGNPKAMRWFSLNDSCKDHFPEYWPLKMVMRFNSTTWDTPQEGTYVDPAISSQRNPREELRHLRANSGGWKLAEQIMTPWLHATIRVYYWATKATWYFYAQHCDVGKTPTQNIIRTSCWSTGGWERSELKDHITTCFENPDCLNDVGLSWGATACQLEQQQDVAKNLATFAFAIASHRWSYFYLPHDQPLPLHQ